MSHYIFAKSWKDQGGNVANASSTFVGASVGGKQVAEQEQEGSAVVLNESDSEDDVDGVASIRKRGRSSGSIWSYFTKDAEPQKRKSAICKHCNVLVNNHTQRIQVFSSISRKPIWVYVRHSPRSLLSTRSSFPWYGIVAISSNESIGSPDQHVRRRSYPHR